MPILIALDLNKIPDLENPGRQQQTCLFPHHIHKSAIYELYGLFEKKSYSMADNKYLYEEV